MPEVIIKYKKPETLKILKGLAKYFDFKISSKKDKEQIFSVGGVTVITADKKEALFDDILVPGDKNIDISELNKIFTGKNIDAKKLRSEAWLRKK